MKVKGEFLFMGVDSAPSFKDPSKTNYLIAFSEGLDSLKMYIDYDTYNKYMTMPPLCQVDVVLNINPVTNRINLVSCTPLGKTSAPVKSA